VSARLTAILCNYNHGQFVGRAIEAIVTQSRPPEELIVVDDGSTDDSVSQIESWTERVPTIRLLRNEHNRGFHASSALALAEARGDYVYSGAADDYVLPGFFEAVMELCERFPQAGIGCGKMVTALPDGTRLRSDGHQRFAEPAYISPEWFLSDCLEAEPPTHSLSSSTAYRRDRLLEIGGWSEELGSWCDTFAIRAIGLKYGICYVPQEVAVWTISPGSLSQSAQKDPAQSVQMVRRVAAKMRSPEFADRFPADYVQRWEHAAFDAVICQQLQPAIDGHQQVQQICRDAERQAAGWRRLLLRLSRSVLRGCYRMAFASLQGAAAQALRDVERANSERSVRLS
jgi:hypothetical protein